MARRPGLTVFPFDCVDELVRRERKDQWDIYASLSNTRIEIKEALAPLDERYLLRVHDGIKDWSLRLTETALNQLCMASGIPFYFFEKVPAPLGLNLIHCLLEMSSAGDGRQYLFRLKDKNRPTLRAVLPQSYCRLDDVDVMRILEMATKNVKADPIRFSVDENIFFVRILMGEDVNIGTAKKRDPAYVGFDVVSSETGAHPLELRYVAFRQVCQNGLTVLSDAQGTFKARYTLMRRMAFEDAVRNTIEDVFDRGRDLTNRIAHSRSITVDEPMPEIEQIFRKYKLGSTKGKLGRWVVQEVVKNLDLFGVRKFDLVQAFTAVARGMEHRDRMRLEDAMGAYLVDGISKN